MTKQGQSTIHSELESAALDLPFLQEYLNNHFNEAGEYPLYVEEAEDDHFDKNPNLMYRVGDNTFIHIYGAAGEETKYRVVEPQLTEDEKEIYDQVRDRMLQISTSVKPPESEDDFDDYFEELFERVAGGENVSLMDKLKSTVGENTQLTGRTKEKLKYVLKRDIVDLGPLNPLMIDEHNEDIHIIGHVESYVDHEVFNLLSTTVSWDSQEDLEAWIKNMGERMDSPISDSTPIVDATLPDGSRINIMYSEDVSARGPSLTIRQGIDVPLTINQITKWGTLSPKLVAYLWLALENDQTIFVVGETASGKTTTLNSMLSFIPRDAKIYSAEDTAEVVPPHDAWQQTLTREDTGDESSDVTMFNLVESALRARPNYILVGEVRGEEAQMAFQAAQTGHPVILTFHASDIRSMIQRMTGEPLNVPETFMDNCNIALFQNRVKRGDEILRRVTSVQEIEGYSDEEEGVITRQTFSWNPRTDEVEFTGVNNSYIMEEKVATLLGYEDTRDIYDEIDRRAKIVERLIDADVLGYQEVNEAYATIQREGVEALDMIQTADVIKTDRP